MKFLWILIVLLLAFLTSMLINGETYHYKVIRKICPIGTFLNPIKDRCQKVPGGGEMIKINLDAKCSGGFIGLLANSRRSKYYYVCDKDFVLTCMCKRNELFSKIRLKCDNKDGKNEKFTHKVVDKIFDKYKCEVMHKSYEDGKILLSGKTEQPKSCESSNHEFISKLQSLLKFLQVIRTIDSSMKSYEESLEVTSISPAIMLPLPISKTITSQDTTTTTEIPNLNMITEEHNEFKKKGKVEPLVITANRIETNETNSFDTSEINDEIDFEKAKINEENIETTEATTTETITDTTDSDLGHLTTTNRIMYIDDGEEKNKLKKAKQYQSESSEEITEHYYSYAYEDELDKILWEKVVAQTPENLILTTTDDTNSKQSDYETTSLQPEITTQNEFDTTITTDYTTTTDSTTNFDDFLNTLPEDIDTTTVEIDTTSINAPSPLIMKQSSSINSIDSEFDEKNIFKKLNKNDNFKRTQAETIKYETTTENTIDTTTFEYETSTNFEEIDSIETENTEFYDEITTDYDWTTLDYTTTIDFTTTEISKNTEKFTKEFLEDETTTEKISTTTNDEILITTNENFIATEALTTTIFTFDDLDKQRFDSSELNKMKPAMKSDILTTTNITSTTEFSTTDYSKTVSSSMTNNSKTTENIGEKSNDYDLSRTTNETTSKNPLANIKNSESFSESTTISPTLRATTDFPTISAAKSDYKVTNEEEKEFKDMVNEDEMEEISPILNSKINLKEEKESIEYYYDYETIYGNSSSIEKEKKHTADGDVDSNDEGVEKKKSNHYVSNEFYFTDSMSASEETKKSYLEYLNDFF